MNCSPYLQLVHDFSSELLGLSFRGPYKNDHVIHYFKAGHGLYRCSGGEVEIVPGLLVLHPPGDEWSFKFADDSSFHMLNIIFDVVERDDSYYPFPPHPSDIERPNLESLEQVTGAALPTVQMLRVPSEFENRFYELHALVGRETVQAQLHRKAIFMEILALLYRNAEEEQGEVSINHEQVLAEAVAILRDQVLSSDPITLPELAARLSVSRSLLYRIFQERLGVPPAKYLTRLKVEQAQVEMILHLRSIKETAELLGFADVHHFTRIFHRQTGSPPGEFVRRYLSK